VFERVACALPLTPEGEPLPQGKAAGENIEYSANDHGIIGGQASL